MIPFPRVTSLAFLSITIAFACSPGTSLENKEDGDFGGDGDGNPGDGDKMSGDGDLQVGDGDLQIGDGDLPSGDGDLFDLIDRPPTPNCADGVLDDDEACDDGNLDSLDGCGSNCRYIEKGYVCPTPGEACRNYAKCGDGLSIFPEQCDDGNVTPGDGCNENCKFEIGFKCEGSPSVCSPAECGNGGEPEGAETCDDGNGLPFDGCSELCQGEPQCTTEGCITTCGDGLMLESQGEECDDGNATSGDGCSADCKLEPGYECKNAPPCPEGEEDCPLNLPIVFRDFNVSHSDFHEPDPPNTTDRPCDGFSGGMVRPTLDDQGKPVFLNAPAKACVSNFDSWYVDTSDSSTILSSVTLYPKGDGSYVNRFGDEGEPYVTSVKTPTESNAGTSLATCETRCAEMARNGQELFMGDGHLRCPELCQPETQAIMQLQNDLQQAEDRLRQAETAAEPDEDLIAEREQEIADIEEAIVTAEEDADACLSDCETELADKTALCAAQCAPCSTDPNAFCVGGATIELDGDPLFFPIDDHPDALMDTRYPARIPAQIYEAPYWPWEDRACGTDATCNSRTVHNFHFTTEIAYWFEYTEGMEADFKFVGDDDVWVFVNRQLVIDLGGIHVPLGGQFTLTANGAITTRTWQPPAAGEEDEVEVELDRNMTTAAALGLEPGKVYEIKVFHAERKPEGSSFQLTLSGFNATRSECQSICGDGILAAGEQCDNGDENNIGGHNGCNSDCTLGSYCGDGKVQKEEGEECDDADPEAPENCNGCRVLEIR